MTEGDKRDDLFEDLDKFFAPIQDVDWPETTVPPARKGEPPSAPQASEAGEPGDTALEEPVEAEEATSVSGQDELFTAEAEEEIEEWAEEEDETGPLFFETEEDLEVEEGGYVELPGEEEAEEPELAEAEEEEPTPEAVLAAADHFAESVRGEVRIEEPEEPEAPSEAEERILAGLEEEGAQVRTVKVGPEGLGGPSWQEPTAVEVGAERERRPMGRDMPAAFLTGLVLGGVAIGAIAIAPAAFAVVASAIVLWAQGELYLAMRKRHHQPATALGLVSGALILGAAYFRGEAAILSMVALSLVATFLWFMAAPPAHRKGVLANVGLTVLGVVYGPVLAGYAMSMLDLPDARELVISVIGLTFVYDTAAFIVGSWWGEHPLAPNISPRKSWQGAIGATLVTVVVAMGAVSPSVELLGTLGRSVGLAVVVAIFAPLGDLAESLLKRDLGLKDMGSILPGHGGVMDRIDSVLFVAPAAFLYLRVVLL